ncbi:MULTISPECIES: glycosyltransferase [Cycloclasticus]|jgi:glycosyltransferase involved in cell wall biosynthesis|uniref:Glycosyltransferase n=1 Tax=Cycloclasticus zancles 78-ME TaxID=1198232 RepID=S5TDX6_9GAMM|nr:MULTISPECIES: glycosyltransferase [Cycloclasticus]AGS39022.1 Glycosyltransferase [Cycloclasticus zancles 78-ME]MBV1899063.1 glycosyltransferase [Cycloclasticus sp.]PHR51012.1 MAG: glycosyltransferase [Cycloclasticus sp.]
MKFRKVQTNSKNSSLSEMKILQISHGYNAPFLGVSKQYESMLNKTNEVVTLYLTGNESGEVKQTTKASKVIFWGCDSKQLKGMKLGLIVKLYKLIKHEKFDLVICHRYKAIYLATMVCLLGLKFKRVGVIHAFGAFKSLGRRLLLSLVAKRLIILGVSNAVRDDIRDSMPLLPRNKVQTLYNAIDVAAVASKQLDKEKARAFLGLNDQAFIIGNVGRLHPDKDQATLIRAFSEFHKQYANSQLVILGTGRLEQQLKDLARELGVEQQALFLGQVPDAVNYYKAFDLFALSSDKEPFGLVLLEAMVAKVPVVASDCGGASEVVSDAGYLFEFADSAALTKLFIRVIARVDGSIVVEKGFSRVHKNFSIEAVAKSFNRLISV